MNRFASPHFFKKISGILIKPMGVSAFILLTLGVYYSLFDSPPDYQQGEYVRFMYVHVPAAWLSLGCFTLMAVMSAIAFVMRHPLADMIAQETAPLGASFALIALVSGAFWGKPMWGAYWVWDARLTSMLLLFILYVGYIGLVKAYGNRMIGHKIARIVALVGFLNIPIIKFSVEWWATLHQPASLLRSGGPSIHESMLLPLLMMAAGFGFFFSFCLLLRVSQRLAQLKQRNARYAS